MARPLPIDRRFDPNLPVVARVPFTANGRRYTRGDVFDWKRMSVDQRRVRQMFDALMLDHLPDGILDDDVEPVVAPPPPSPPSPSDVDLEGIDDMVTLREIATREGAPFKVSKAEQRAAIIENRARGND